MQRKEGLPSARGQRKKGDRLCHVITPRDKARALKKSTKKKASVSYERRENFLQKNKTLQNRRWKEEREQRKKKKLRPGSKRGKEMRRRVKRGRGIDVLFNRIFHQLSASFSSFWRAWSILLSGSTQKGVEGPNFPLTYLNRGLSVFPEISSHSGLDTPATPNPIKAQAPSCTKRSRSTHTPDSGDDSRTKRLVSSFL